MESKFSKLLVNKSTISALNNEEMRAVKGGFTYSLSMGGTCQASKKLTASNAVQCGKATQTGVKMKSSC